MAERALRTAILLLRKAKRRDPRLESLDYKSELAARKALANKQGVGHSSPARRGAARSRRIPVAGPGRPLDAGLGVRCACLKRLPPACLVQSVHTGSSHGLHLIRVQNRHRCARALEVGCDIYQQAVEAGGGTSETRRTNDHNQRRRPGRPPRARARADGRPRGRPDRRSRAARPA